MRVRRQYALGRTGQRPRPDAELLQVVYASLLEGFAEAAAIVSRSGDVVATNRAFLEVFSRPPETGQVLALSDLFHPASEQLLAGPLGDVAAGASRSLDGLLTTRDGHVVALGADMRPVPAVPADTRLILLQLRAGLWSGQVVAQTAAEDATPDVHHRKDVMSPAGQPPAGVFPDRMMSFPADEPASVSARRLAEETGAEVASETLAEALALTRKGSGQTLYLRTHPVLSVARDGLRFGALPEEQGVEVRFFCAAKAEGPASSATVWAAIRSDVADPVEVAEIRRLAYQDIVTGLANRRAFQRDLEREMTARTGTSQGGVIAVLCVDLDEFKKINDLAGHACGDEMLRLVAGCLTRRMGERGTAARTGGDEFAATVFVSGEEEALELSRRLRDDLAALTLPRNGRIFSITGSIGVSLFDPAQASGEELAADLIHHADTLCLKGKRQGGGTCLVEWHQPDLDPDPDRVSLQTAALAERLAPAWGAADGSQTGSVQDGEDLGDLKLEELELHAMPLVRLTDLKPLGQEVLLRHREGDDRLTPSQLIALADRRGWLAQVDTWIMDQVIDLALAHADRSLIGLNVSAAAATGSGLRELLRARLQGNPLLAGRLSVEISERDLLREPEGIGSFLTICADLGIHTVLDDFTGNWVAMDRLVALRFSAVKVNPVMTRPAVHDARKLSLLRCLVTSLKDLGIRGIAKHLQSADELEAMRQAGFWGGQGFHIGAARPWSGGPVGQLHG